MLLFLADHWTWLLLAYLVGVGFALVLCRAAGRDDQALRHALDTRRASGTQPVRSAPEAYPRPDARQGPQRAASARLLRRRRRTA